MNNWKPKKDPFLKREAYKYKHPVPSREYILAYFKKHKKPQSKSELIHLFNLKSPFEKEAFRRRLRAMVRDGQLMKTRRGKYSLIEEIGLIQGRVIGHKDGFGFVEPEDGTSRIFISSREMRKVFDGDLVTVRIIDVNRTNNKREGMINEVLERSRTQIAGRFFRESGVGFVTPDNKRITHDIIIPPGDQFNAKVGQLVLAKIFVQPTERALPIGKITKILGDYMAPGMEIETAIHSYELPHDWPEDILQGLKKLLPEILVQDKKKRADLCDKPFVTIDGEDAKDFDDAVYCETLPKAGFRLYVAIADVSHYVKPNTSLDYEAKARGNSVYFPGKVVPMLPEKLSNELCSLNPEVERLTIVCDMAIDSKGTIKRYRFYRAVIRSHARLTYTKVANMLIERDKALLKQYHHVSEPIQTLYDLFKVLFQKRTSRGAIDFEIPEIQIEFGKNRKIKQLLPKLRNDAHRIIEECMLCANVCAAEFILKHKQGGLYRVHDGPTAEKLSDLRVFLGELGLKLGGGDLPKPKDYAKLLMQVKERPDANFIQTVLLRSLAQAFYSPDNDGHFGLAYDCYTHFTSPIRRYPDLIVHRTICAIIEHLEAKKLPDYDALKLLGEHCSMTERRADEATREVIDWLKCEYMRDKLGNVFDGIITGVTGFGFFVALKDIFVEGLVPIATLTDDYYHFDTVRYRLVGTRSGKIYRIGHSVTIQVARVDLEDREIDFVLIN
ncbi:MAG: ribonuclease R [Gammaproteobacteria bacterium]|nr:ribonuclease R [Gammaproteobacteria bacterium]